ncbi:MAG: FecR domain-containing protein, partial [Pelagibacteraceae bacterium]
MKKNNIFHMRYINTAFKKIYLLLILTSLFFLISINITHSEEKIGSIVSIKNEVFAINADGEKRLLDLYDEILLQDKIVTNELSTATVQYNDNSTIIIKKSSSFKVTDFNITGVKNIFLGEVQKGSVIIESGKIAKDDNGSMVIELPKMTLGIKGTRFNIENKPDGTSAVSLAEDSFGNVGIINISSEGKVKTLFDTEQVVSTNTETGFSERVKTDDEKKELVDASNDLIEASSIDENIIQKNLEEKLLNGSLLDANGDGVIDTLDVEVIKETIKLEKQEKIDFIVDNSTGENTEFLSQVLNKSDEASIGDSINKIFEINNDLVASVITNLSNEDNTFLTTSNSEANNAIKEKIYTQMLSNSANVETIGKIISKSDGATIEKMINIVSLSDTNDPNSNLSLQVLSSVADANAATDPAGLNTTFLNTGGQSEVNKLIESAVTNAGNNPESSKMLANVITKSDAGSISLMINRIQTVSESNPNSNLSLQVLSSVADANAARA